jgi:hypothetical protein
MQYQNFEEDRRDDSLLKNLEERLELSAAWRALLGFEASAPAQAAPVTAAPVLANDPWSALLRTQGIQMIDLQQLQTKIAQSSLDERDVELALDNIQEQLT